jgi:hypothetical protein
MEQMEMDTFLEEALATGRIRQSKSPLGAPVFFIKFYRYFIPGFSHHACALFNLTMEDIRFI